MNERKFYYIDRWGAEFEGEPSVEKFLELYDAIASPDDDQEHTVVDIRSSDDWNIEVSKDTVWCERVEDGENLGSLPIASKDELAAIIQQFIDGDFDGLRTREWR
jgi:hypothetical protein